MKKVVIGVVLTLFIVNYGFYMYEIIKPGPKCLVDSCDRKAMEGCEFCKMHHSADDGYYHVCGEINRMKEKIHSTFIPSTSSNKTSSNTSKNTSTNKATSKPNKSNNKNNSYDYNNSYDDGYEDVYEDDDYDWDRYYSDDDYADGVDDAMDELDW